MRHKDVHVGMQVTICNPEWAWYGGLVDWTSPKPAPNYQDVIMQPGEVATVRAIECPSVTHNRTFCSIEFVRDGVIYRTGVLYRNLRKIKDVDTCKS